MKLKNLNLSQFELLAKKTAKQFRNKPGILGLIGPLGSGKTTFVKNFTSALGGRQVKSPTFVIAHQYRIKKQTIHHLDFYRLNNSRQLNSLGLSEIFNNHDIVLIEWVDKFPSIKKLCTIILKFKVNQSGTRDVTISNN